MDEVLPKDKNDTKFLIKAKIEDMMKYGKPAIRNFPRRERRTADEMLQAMLNLYHYAIALEKKYYKKTTLQDLDVELAYLKHLVRVAADKDYYNTGKNPVPPPLSRQQYEVWSKMLDEIGNMVGGYMKYVK
ncbi:MAG: diversity-generating retroelement protein Avd [Oscillospiraceae bacterium]|nr:diversity-generating retroelement protein Avd [Oscillospiraceae bacterium]